MNIEQMMTEAFAADNKKLHARLSEIEQLARDLLARLSQDYGDSEEGDNDPAIEELFDRGDQLLPIVSSQTLQYE